MTWDGWLSLAANVTGLVMFAVAVIGWLSSSSGAIKGELGIKEPEREVTSSDSDNVVLRFAPGNIERERTLEYEAEQFKNKLPVEYRHRLLFEPVSTLHFARAQLRRAYSLATASALLFIVSTFVNFPTDMEVYAALLGLQVVHGPRDALGAQYVVMPVLTIMVIIFPLGLAAASFRMVGTAKKAIRVVDAYLKFLEDREVRIESAFVQSRRKSDLEKSRLLHVGKE
jgi:hypothetical protein